jgi:hypothetical protein
MEVNIATRSLMIIVHTMGFIERKIVPGTPQENGVSERMNMTIMEHARSMRLHAWVSLIVLGRCCRYCCLLNKQRTFKFFGWWHSRGGMDR